MQEIKLYNLSNNFGFTLNSKANVINVLPTDSKPFGLSSIFFINKPFTSFFSSEFKKKVNQYIKNTAFDKVVAFEYEAINKLGIGEWYKVSIICKLIESKKLYFVHFNNINEQKKQLIKNEKIIEELKQANAFNHEIIHTTQAIILRLDINTNIVSLSKGAEKILGFTSSELLQKNWFKTIVPENKFPQLKKGFAAFIKSQKKIRVIVAPVICKDETKKIISWKTNKIFVDGILIGTVSIGKDVTEITQRVEQLQDSEKKFRGLAELVPTPISFISTSGEISFFNKAYTKVFGYTINEVSDVKTLINISYKNEKERKEALKNWKLDVAFLKKGKPIQSIKQIVYNKKGQKRIMEYSATMSQNFIHYAYIDITAQIEKEASLLEGKETFKRIAENTPVAIAGCDVASFKVIFANKRFVEVLGYSVQDINTMKDWGDIIVYNNDNEKEQSLAVWQKVKEELFTNKKSIIKSLERKIRCKNGSVKHIEVAVTYDNNTIYALFYDITERKIAEANLIDSEKRFRELAELLPTPLSCKTIDDKIIFVNQAYITQFGYTVADIPNFQKWLQNAYRNKADRDQAYKIWKEDVEILKAGKPTKLKILEVYNKAGLKRIVENRTTISGNYIYCSYNDITERKESEKILKESEARFRNLAEQMSFPVSFVTIDGTFIFLNNAFTNKFGYTLEDFPNIKTVVNNTNINYKAKKNGINSWENEIKNLFKNKKTITNIIDVETKNGEIKQVEYSASLSDDFVFYIYSDITEQKRAEQKMIENEERFRSIVENLPIPLVSINPITGVIFSNKKHQNIIGHNNLKAENTDNIEKFSINDLVDEKSRVHFNILLNKVKNNGIDNTIIEPSYLIKILCKDKKIRTFEITENIFGNTLYTVFHDITEQIKATELLKESEQKFKALAENMPISIGAYDLKGRVIFINNYFTYLTGYKIADVPTIKDWYKQTQPNTTRRIEFYNYWIKTVADFRAGKLLVKPEIKASSRCKDGSFKYFTYSFSIHNDITYILIIDITEQEKAKKQLEKSHQELRSLASHLQNIREEERKFVAREIHDELGQQLTGIKMDVSAIFKKIKPISSLQDTEFKQVLEMLNLSVKTVRKISSQLRPSILDDLGLSAAIEWQAQEFSKRAGVICVFNNSLNNEIFAPEIQSNLFRILQESLTNIMRHAAAKNVLIDLQNIDNSICLTISDDGKGFNQKISKPTLGLLGMKERAIMMKGSFAMESVKGKGTIVRIYVPT